MAVHVVRLQDGGQFAVHGNVRRRVRREEDHPQSFRSPTDVFLPGERVVSAEQTIYRSKLRMPVFPD